MCEPGAPEGLSPPPTRRSSMPAADLPAGSSLRSLLLARVRHRLAARRERQIVLHVANAGDVARDFRRPGARVDVLDLAGQDHDPRLDLGIDLGALQLGILLELLLDVLIDDLVV